MANPLDPSSPVVLTFDHPPTDAELPVYQPRLNPGGAVRLRKLPQEWTIEYPRISWMLLTFWLLSMSGITAMAIEAHAQGDSWHGPMFAAVVFTVLCLLGWHHDRATQKLGPLVRWLPERGELRIVGREGPIVCAEVTEIVELQYRVTHVIGRNRAESLYLVVHRRDGVYTAERLYHGPITDHATWDIAPQLSKALNVGLRCIDLTHLDPVLSNFPNTKPPKKLRDITRK